MGGTPEDRELAAQVPDPRLATIGGRTLPPAPRVEKNLRDHVDSRQARSSSR